MAAAEEKDAGSSKQRVADNVVGVVLVAIGGGIGVLGFVAFFGAAILWVRMDEAGVPANEAIAVVPKSVLVTTGASFLVPPVLLSLMLVGLLYLADRLIRGFTDLLFLREQKKELAEARMAAERHQASIDLAIEQAAERSRRLKATARKAVAAGANPSAVDLASEEASEEMTLAHHAAGEAQPASKKADDDVAEATKEVELERDKKKLRIERTRKGLRFFVVAIALFFAAVPGVLLSSVGLQGEQLAIVLGVLLFLSAVCLVILASNNFAWFALAIVVAVGLLNGFITYYRTGNDPKVEPAAVLRSNGVPVFGFFVAQTSDRVYIGTRNPGGGVRLDAIPRGEVVDLAVAGLIPPHRARRRARILALQMCRVARRRSEETLPTPVRNSKLPSPDVKTEVPCTDSDVKRLRASLETTGVGPA